MLKVPEAGDTENGIGALEKVITNVTKVVI